MAGHGCVYCVVCAFHALQYSAYMCTCVHTDGGRGSGWCVATICDSFQSTSKVSFEHDVL